MLPETIPVYSVSGRLLEYIERDTAEQMRFQYRIVRSRRGVIQRAVVRERHSTIPLSHRGESFIQSEVGQVWALRGVRGSGARSESGRGGAGD